MSIPSDDRFSETFATAEQKIAALRQMTVEELLHLGKRRVAYLKGRQDDDGVLFVLYGADGSVITVADDIADVEEVATDLGLRFINVH
jgi:hypothetical protein